MKDTAFRWTCARCGHVDVAFDRPVFGASRPWSMDPPTCHACFRRIYNAVLAEWARPSPLLADAAGILTGAGRAALMEHVGLILDVPDRKVFELAILAAAAVAVRVPLASLELTFVLGPGAPRVVNVPGPLPVDFTRDLIARIALDFTLHRKITA